MANNRMLHFLYGCRDFIEADKTTMVAKCSVCGAERTFKKEERIHYPWTSPDVFKHGWFIPIIALAGVLTVVITMTILLQTKTP